MTPLRSSAGATIGVVSAGCLRPGGFEANAKALLEAVVGIDRGVATYDRDGIVDYFTARPQLMVARALDFLLAFRRIRAVWDNPSPGVDRGATLRSELSALGPVAVKVGQTLSQRALADLADPVKDKAGYVYDRSAIEQYINAQARRRGPDDVRCPVSGTAHVVRIEELAPASDLLRAVKRQRALEERARAGGKKGRGGRDASVGTRAGARVSHLARPRRQVQRGPLHLVLLVHVVARGDPLPERVDIPDACGGVEQEPPHPAGGDGSLRGTHRSAEGNGVANEQRSE